MTDPELEAAMERALRLAEKGPVADPNPRVGCVLIRDGQVIAEGWHEGAGTLHAEVMALTRAGAAARGATAVVTLEPCNHTGRTGPCSVALLDAGVARVVYAQADPNPVASGGAERLRAAGVPVTGDVLAERAEAVNDSWSFARRNQRPHVTWKFAASLDGRSAAADGTSNWITGDLMRQAMNRRRGRCGAVVVGTGTILTDDPRLTAREDDGAPSPHQPLRVVVGKTPVPGSARVRGTDGRFRQYAGHDPRAVLESLLAEGVHRVWLEGGPRLAAAWWRAGVIDQVIACLAPALLGTGRAAVADLGIDTLAGIARLRLTEVLRHGDDIALVCVPPTATQTQIAVNHPEEN
nr:bifunctional diaminohydroxyphosphoribosylaminopyrimidine deaminase/5-amino-6-(5-phosphoribosylamino)uracil reductase RibD [Tessaracoccus bendigoensis]